MKKIVASIAEIRFLYKENKALATRNHDLNLLFRFYVEVFRKNNLQKTRKY
jgi:hypothetical protein